VSIAAKTGAAVEYSQIAETMIVSCIILVHFFILERFYQKTVSGGNRYIKTYEKIGKKMLLQRKKILNDIEEKRLAL